MAIFVKHEGVAHSYDNLSGLARIHANVDVDHPDTAAFLHAVHVFVGLDYDVLIDFDMGIISGLTTGDGTLVSHYVCPNRCFGKN